MHKYLLTILITLCLPGGIYAQEVQITLGKRFESARSSVIRIDSVVFFEDNLNSQKYPIGINLKVPVSRRLHYMSGIQFYRPATGYAAYKDTVCTLCPVVKATTIGHPTLEFPQQLTFSLFKSGNWQAEVLGGITPALRTRIRQSPYTGAPNPPDWDEGVIKVLNAASSTVKRAYVNYHYGFQIQYRRVGILTFWQQNLSKNLAKPLDLGGKQYPLVRRTGSLQFSLTYTFLKLKKPEG